MHLISLIVVFVKLPGSEKVPKMTETPLNIKQRISIGKNYISHDFIGKKGDISVKTAIILWC